LKSKSFRFYTALLSIGLLILLTGCAAFFDVWGGAKREPDASPKGMYDYASDLLKKKKYEKATEAFKKIKEEHPLSEYTPLAELRTADSVYLDKNYAEAIVLYEEFKKLHPLHPEVPYSVYQLGMCHYKQLPAVDRDQTETQKAVEQFRYLIENFSQSQHVAEGKIRLRICQRQLAHHELYIAQFYMRVDKYKAALGRLEGLLEKFPEAELQGKVEPLMKKCRTEIAKAEEKKKKQEAKEDKKKKTAVKPPISPAN
jgi:outer membrane protein assembly factor BamD